MVEILCFYCGTKATIYLQLFSSSFVLKSYRKNSYCKEKKWEIRFYSYIIKVGAYSECFHF